MILRRDGEREGGRSSAADGLALFSVLWALAAVWHLLGNTTLAPAWAQALLALGALLVLWRPGAVVPLAVLAAAGLVTIWEEAPLLGNHWLLAGMVNLAILLAVAVGVLRRRATDRADLADRLFPAARLCLLAFYVFAGFAKLNSAFFDRTVSCAVHYFRESTASIGLGRLQLGGAAWLEHSVIVGTVAVELAIPVLLVVRRTRTLGVLVALVFHALLAVDHTHQFFDFSSVLFALFTLFLHPRAGTWVAERIGSIRARLALRGEALPHRLHLAFIAVPAVAGALVSVDAITGGMAQEVGWFAWHTYAAAVVAAVALLWRQERRPASVRLLPHHALFLLVPLLVVGNGLTPYLELKTGYGWNMYANLRTVDGESNHLIVRRTLPLTDEQDDLVEIISTNDAGLVRYQATGYALTWRQLRRYLSERPDRAITYSRGDEVVALQRASDRPELVEPVPTWRDKVQLFRAVDLTSPERCVPTFGPAR